MKVLGVLLLVVAASWAMIPASAPGGSDSQAAASMERKLRRIERNASSTRPPAQSTEFTEDEINAYFAAPDVDLPNGVESVHFQGEPGVVTATTKVDFDRLKTGGSSNPLLEMFTGVHDVVVVAHAHGTGGTGYVQVDSVSLDGVNLPRVVLQLFVDKYVHPRYPDLGLDSKFPLPDRIDSATVGNHILTVSQK